MDEILKELSRLEAETGKSRSDLFREWIRSVPVKDPKRIAEK